MLNLNRLPGLLRDEVQRFERTHPRSRAAMKRAKESLLGGVPMPWMTEWVSPFPPFVAEAVGAELTDLDGNVYTDFCLGDTGAMAGHSPEPVRRALSQQAGRGNTTMLPGEDATWVAEELTRRFEVPYWQFAVTATDANRFTIRLARQITGRSKVVVFNWCYHGSVDESLAVLQGGAVVERPQNIGAPVDVTLTTRVVEWNDPEALAEALADEDVACVLAEPALTNIGIVPPTPGFHDDLRRLTGETGTLLILDETHTFCAGPGGMVAAHDLNPDIVTLGKAIGGGVPAAAYGMTQSVIDRMGDLEFLKGSDVGGVGGTLAGNALSLAAARATLGEVLTQDAFEHMTALATRFRQGFQDAIDEWSLPWSVSQLGARVEYLFLPWTPRTGGEAHNAVDRTLETYLHLYMLNRGVLLTPFHNMALMCPATTERHVDRHTEVFRDAIEELR